MTEQEFYAEAYKRIKINEGFKTSVYKDPSGIPTVGIGFNLERADAESALHSCGLNLENVLQGEVLTDDEVEKLFNYSFRPVVEEASASLQPGHYDALTDARKFVVCDLVFNMGPGGWGSFTGTIALLNQACHSVIVGNPTEAHRLFGLVADRLLVSEWALQVGDRAKRDIAMMRTSQWVDPTGNGTE